MHRPRRNGPRQIAAPGGSGGGRRNPFMNRATRDTSNYRFDAGAAHARLPGRRAAAAAGSVLVVFVSLLTGCASEVQPPEPSFPIDFAQPEGTLKAPRIISGSKRRDAAAYDDSVGELTESDWA